MDSLLISPVMSERILVGSNCSFLVDSLLKVVLGSVNSVGEDGLDLLDDGDFVSSKGEKMENLGKDLLDKYVCP